VLLLKIPAKQGIIAKSEARPKVETGLLDGGILGT